MIPKKLIVLKRAFSNWESRLKKIWNNWDWK